MFNFTSLFHSYKNIRTIKAAGIYIENPIDPFFGEPFCNIEVFDFSSLLLPMYNFSYIPQLSIQDTAVQPDRFNFFQALEKLLLITFVQWKVRDIS